jgi:DHA2 family multidrug resistance protein-like MFS transporter
MVSRFVGAAVGVAAVGTIFSAAYSRALSSSAPAGVDEATLASATSSVQGAMSEAGHIGGSTGTELAAAARDAFGSGMAAGFAAVTVLALGATVLAWFVLSGEGVARSGTTGAVDSVEPAEPAAPAR